MTKKLFIIAIVLAAPACVFAQDAPPLTLDAAIAEALADNPTLVALRRELDVVRQRPAQEHALEPPTLEAAIWQWPLDTLNPLNTNMYMFTMRQDIPGRGKRELRAAVAGKDAERAANDIATKARDVVAQVKHAYVDLFIARQAVGIHEAGVDLLRQVADLTTTRYATGHGGQQDALKAVTEISKLHEDLIDLDEQAKLAAAQLNTLLNRDPAAPVGELTVVTSLQTLPALFDLQQRAVGANAEIQGARLDLERAEAAAAVAASAYKPDYMVGGGYQLMPRTPGAWTASIGVTWPGAPWARSGLDAKKAEAQADVSAAQARIDAAANAVRAAVQQAYIRASAATEKAALLDRTIIPQSQQVLDVMRVAYESNRGDITPVIAQQHELLEARLDYYRALAALEDARADLEYAVGDGQPLTGVAAVEVK